MTRSNPGVHSIQIGEVSVTALNDGQFRGSFDLVTGSAPDRAEALLRDTFRAIPPRITVSCFLVETPDRRFVVDFGTSGLFGPVLGFAAKRLDALGVTPDSIEAVLLTHGHPDHVGGLVDAGGAPVFPNAELVVSGIEADYWTSDANRDGVPEASRSAFEPPRRALAAYAPRLRRITDGDAVFPGVTARWLPGHTPGHTGFHIASGPESLLIWADVVHLPGIQFADPAAGVAFDVDGDRARATRAALFDEVASSGQLIAGMHLDFPPFAHVRRNGSAFALEPMVWSPSAAGLAA